jgi:hypothetical protein
VESRVGLVFLNIIVVVRLIKQLTSPSILMWKEIEGMRHGLVLPSHEKLQSCIILLSTNNHRDSRAAKVPLVKVWGAGRTLERTRGADRWVFLMCWL